MLKGGGGGGGGCSLSPALLVGGASRAGNTDLAFSSNPLQ